MTRRYIRLHQAGAAAASWLAAASPSFAAEAPAAPAAAAPASEVLVITATRLEARAFDVPASITRIGADDIGHGRAQVNVSESLGAVPGLLARDRQNYAQDVQISVRGFGARASFGIRGVRLYVDGIPATLPDGQGQITHLELGAVDRIEVLRGPFSALYGNASGGVIQVFTEDGSGPPRLSLSAAAGSDGLLRLGAKASGRSAGLAYTLSASGFETDGYRQHSATRRHLGNVKLSLQPDEAGTLTLVANSLGLPLAQDPLGLTRAQMEADPRGVDPAAQNFDTRKTVSQTQLGLRYERRLGAQRQVQLQLYGGKRNTEQFQSIPVGTQTPATHPGGVILLGRDYHGADLRFTQRGTLGGVDFSLVAGLAWDTLQERRRGYQNFTGSGAEATLGVKGAPRRDERNEASNTDPYLQTSWRLAEHWTLNAGLRHSRIRFSSQDAYVVGSNPDDSGGARFSATLPALGLLYAPSDTLRLYASAGRGFETPTLNELAYRPGGATGLNFALNAAESRSVEFGIKLRPTRWGGLGEWTLAVFHTGTDNEIVTQTNSGGRATFQNAGRTQRQGLELAASHRVAGHLRLQAAYTRLDATYRSDFLTCTAAPCTTPSVRIPAGNRIPGLARDAAYLAAQWQPPSGWQAGLELRALSRVAVNDANSDAAAGHAVMAASLGYAVQMKGVELRAGLRVDNLFDRRHVGSVIVNDGNGRFFEPAPGRTWLGSVQAGFSF